MGNDTLNADRQSDLQAGDLFDGGAGGDTLLLREGVGLPACVTLTSIEKIIYG